MSMNSNFFKVNQNPSFPAPERETASGGILIHSHKSPLSDSMFKAIFGHCEHEHILRHFLNALLEQTFGFSVEKLNIQNPANEKDCIDAKLTIVNVKAVDNYGRVKTPFSKILNHSRIFRKYGRQL